MGIVDRINETLNKGVSETERVLEVGKLKTRITALGKGRAELLTALGAVTYDQWRKGENDPAAFTALGEKIRAAELEIAQTQARLNEVESGRDLGQVSCPSCGARNAHGAVFCTRCGTPIPVAEPMTPCASCGATLPATGKFCVRCGTPVEEPADDGTASYEAAADKEERE